MTNRKLKDQIKAARKGSREAELQNASGFIAQNRVHKSKKAYNRKNFRVRISD